MRGWLKDWNGTLKERFERMYIPEPNSGCFLWIGAIGGEDERGFISMNGMTHGAHRVSWLLHRGKIPSGLHVLHTCDVPSCVNPDHLWLGTHADNMKDSARKGRTNGGGFSLKGEDSSSAKLTSAAVLEIRTKALRQKDYVLKFGISQQHVSDIQRRKKWKHLF